MKKLMMTLMAVLFAIAANAQYNTNYYNQYGGSIGSSTIPITPLSVPILFLTSYKNGTIYTGTISVSPSFRRSLV